jgi:hypothetical protein
MSLFVLAIILMHVIGLVAFYRVWAKREQSRQEYGCIATLLRFGQAMLLSVTFAVYFLGVVAAYLATRNYYDRLSAELLLYGNALIWAGAFLGGAIMEVIKPISLAGRKLPQRFFYVLFSIAFLMPLVAFGLPAVLGGATGLLSGPQPATGVVAEKNIVNTSRGVQLYFMTIGNQEFHVVDWGWWDSVREGQRIEYVYNRHAPVFPEAFPPDDIAFTPAGAFVAICGVWAWVVTLALALDGLLRRV